MSLRIGFRFQGRPPDEASEAGTSRISSPDEILKRHSDDELYEGQPTPREMFEMVPRF